MTVAASIFQSINFFRLSGAVFSLGLTLLSLIVPPWLMQSKESFNFPYFSWLHSFSFGALMGIGLVGMPFESSNDLQIDSRIVWILMSVGFISCLLFENIVAIRSSYSSYIDDRPGHNSSNNNQIEMVEDDSEIETFQQRSKDDEVLQKITALPDEVKAELKSLNLFAMSNMLLGISLYNICHGIKLGSMVDYRVSYGILLRFLAQKVMISLAFSSYISERDFDIMKDLVSPLIYYSSAAPVGILIGSCTQYWSNESDHIMYELSSFIQSYSFTMAGYMAACAAGICTYLATCHLLPYNFAVYTRGRADLQKVFEIISFIAGYIMSVIMCMSDQKL